MNSQAKFLKGFRILIISLLAGACIEPFTPDVNQVNTRYLVVDGFLNTTGDVTVKLTRTRPLQGEGTIETVNGASVIVESNSGFNFFLTETESGVYRGSVNVNLNDKYNLKILLVDGKTYESDEVTPLISPEIDSIAWGINSNNDLEIKVNTHDDSGNSRYYKWNFLETWEYVAPFESTYILDGAVRPRTADEKSYLCYQTKSSSEILIASSSRSVSDQIRNQVVTTIPAKSSKIQNRYSIEVEQQVLSPEVYAFWRELEKTTETLGTLFDPLPGTVLGNIHATDGSSDPVLGIFTSGSTSRKRIFISRLSLPSDVRGSRDKFNCFENYIEVDQVQSLNSNSYITTAKTLGLAILGYYYTDKGCADCRVQGGTTTKPEFW